jgi:hypothetical protein
MELKVSTMTGKMQHIPAINTNTLTNPFCIKMHAGSLGTPYSPLNSDNPGCICVHCYSHEQLNGYRKNCAPVWQRNSDLLSGSVLSDDQIPVINSHSFRFHGHGELLNSTHYFNFCRIARKNPKCTFALWTKRRDIKSSVRPDNLILIYSNPTIDKVMHKPPVGFDKVFNNTSSLTKADNCSGRKCIECLKCYRLDSGVDVIIEKVK